MLYQTYRPTTWDEVVGQSHVVRTLQGALKASRIGHAYLFAGPRGTGKTTLARIWAKAVNCAAKQGHPCGVCDSCKAITEGNALDLVEIDAASNRGIDDVRQLKETAATAPAAARRKVFIIDEVHMLSKDAFNALLKLLEEPPEHALFVLATTEPHKILPTVLSRVQRFDFKKLTQQEIVGKLSDIAKREKLQVSDEALGAVALASDGALRDAEVMLTKLASHANDQAIDGEMVQRVLGLVPVAWHERFTTMLHERNRVGGMTFLNELQQQGVDMDQFARGLLEYLRLVLMMKINPEVVASAGLALAESQATRLRELATTMDGKLLVAALQAFTSARTRLRTSPIASLPLELAVLELTTEKSAV